jgi:environmental stress-induced protein Ves
MPWRNGGGTTTELAREPHAVDDFDWRLSVAEVASDGPFSSFVGYDRIIVLLSGGGMDLRFANTSEVVALREPLDHHQFAGERDVQATLVRGGTTDLNLIWRRSRLAARIETVEVRGEATLGTHDSDHVAFVVRGEVDGPEFGRADAADAIVWRGSCHCRGAALLALFTLVNATERE